MTLGDTETPQMQRRPPGNPKTAAHQPSDHNGRLTLLQRQTDCCGCSVHQECEHQPTTTRHAKRHQGCRQSRPQDQPGTQMKNHNRRERAQIGLSEFRAIRSSSLLASEDCARIRPHRCGRQPPPRSNLSLASARSLHSNRSLHIDQNIDLIKRGPPQQKSPMTDYSHCYFKHNRFSAGVSNLTLKTSRERDSVRIIGRTLCRSNYRGIRSMRVPQGEHHGTRISQSPHFGSAICRSR